VTGRTARLLPSVETKGVAVATFVVKVTDEAGEISDEEVIADSYGHEEPFTTFYRVNARGGREPIATYRSDRIWTIKVKKE
jgi:hypothetical protein